jgi:hypothetical protein
MQSLLASLTVLILGVPAFAQRSTVGGCPVFPADNIWNTRIDSQPVDPQSANYINNITATGGIRNDDGIGITVVPGSQPFVPIFPGAVDESDPGPYPIPANAYVEGGDQHVIVVDSGNCVLYELFFASLNPDGSWNADSSAKWSLLADGLRPSGWTSADAAGLPILPGLLLYDEMISGHVNHAIRFTAPHTQRLFVWPARHFASSITDPTYPPMGQRFRLKASFDISGFSPNMQVILQAMKTYGLILADNGLPWEMQLANDSRWDFGDLDNLRSVAGVNFEAVSVGNLMVNPDSAQASFAAPPLTGTAAFVDIDIATQGNWKTTYGADGYNVIEDVTSYPAYAVVTPTNSYIQGAWTNSTSDVRALQKASSNTDRLAATWYSQTAMTFDINILDSNTHRLALYVLDWDFAGRSERVDVLDVNGKILDTQILSNFGNGQYLVWNLGGHVTLRVTNLGATSAAVVSGFFFGGALPASSVALQSVSVSPASVIGGSNVGVTVNLTGPATGSGIPVSLTGSNGAFPNANVTVPVGQSSQTFNLPTGAVQATTAVTVTGSYNGTAVSSNSFTVNPPAVALQSVSISPASVTGGGSVSVTVNLTAPAPGSGAAVTLTGSSSAFPTTVVTVSANQTSQTFNNLPTNTVLTATSVTITASYNNSSVVSNSFTVNPASTGSLPVALVAHTVSNSFTATNTTIAINTTGATLIVLATNQEFEAFGAPTDSAGNTWTLIARQDNSAWYYCLNPTTSANHTFTIGDSMAGIYRTSITVEAFSGSFTGLDTQSSVYTSSSYQPGAITPAHNGELLVSLVECFVENVGAVAVDSNFTITDYTPINSNPYAFAFAGMAYYVQPTAAAINPTWSGLNSIGYRQMVAQAAFLVSGGSPPSVAVQSVSVSPASVTGGSNVSVTVNLTGQAPSGGALVTLTGSNGAFPTGSLTVPASQNSMTSSLPTASVQSTTSVTVTAGYNGSSATSNSFTVNPVPPAVTLQSVSVSPASVTGGSNVSVTVNLTAPAPSGGAAVTLTGSNAAFPKANLTIPANQTTFTSATVPTAAVQTTTAVTVTASYNGASAASNSFTVNPAASSSPVSLVAHTISTGFGATNFTTPINTVGATLIVLATNQEFVGFSAPTDSAGNTWTLIARQDNFAWYYCLNPATSGSHTFSIGNTLAGIYRTSLAVQAFSGTFTGLDTQANSYVSGSNQAGVITPSHNGELLVSLLECFVENPGTVALDSGFTITDSTPVNSSPYAFAFAGLVYSVQPAAVAVNPSWNGLNSVGYRQFVATAAFK